MRECPFCQKKIEDTDVKCRYCGSVSWFDKTKKPALHNVVYYDKFSTSSKQLEPLETNITDENDAKIKKMRIIATVVLVVLYIVVFIYSYITGKRTLKDIEFIIGILIVPSIAYIVYMIYPKHRSAQYAYYVTAILFIIIPVIATLQIQRENQHLINPYSANPSENKISSASAPSSTGSGPDSTTSAAPNEQPKSEMTSLNIGEIKPQSEEESTRNKKNPYEQIRSMNDKQFIKFVESNKNSKNPLPGIGYVIDKKSRKVRRLIQEPHKGKE